MAQVLALPLRVNPASGSMVTLTQDSEAEVAQSLALLLSTRPGERRSVPDYGIPDPVFGGVRPQDVVAAAQEWEERADPLVVEQIADGDLTVQHLTVRAAAITTEADDTDLEADADLDAESLPVLDAAETTTEIGG